MIAIAIPLLGIWFLWSGGGNVSPPQRPAADQRNRVAVVRRPEPGAESPKERGPLRVVGRVIAIDRAGREHHQEDGLFHLVESTERGPARFVLVPVAKGAWEATLVHGRRALVRDMQLGGRPALVEDRTLVASDDGIFTLRARWRALSVLHVVDNATGRPLTDVEVVRLAEFFHDDEFHPGGASTAPVVAGTTSPVTLPPRDRTTVYWARARGFAWGRIRIDGRGGGERVLRLRRGGILEVTLANRPPNRRLHMSLRSEGAADAAPLLESVIPGSGAVRLRDVEAGRYEVHVTSAEWYRQPRLLGSAGAVIEPDSVCTLTIHLTDAGEAAAAVPLEGVLVIPSAWGDIDASLTIETARGTSESLLKEMLSGTGGRQLEHVIVPQREMVRDEKGNLRWSAGQLPPGEYVATVSGVSYQAVLHVGPTGNTTARIQVPEPAIVVFRTVDEASGAPVPIRELNWNPVWASYFDMGSQQTARSSPEPGLFRVRAPVGAIQVSVPDEMWALASSEAYEVRQGTNEHSVRLVRLSRVRVTLRDGDSAVPYELGQEMVAITSVDGHQEYETRWGDGSVLFLVRHPGEYEISFGRIPGFEQVAPKRVMLRRGETKALVIPLQRAQ